MKRDYFVYILKCADGTYYTGVTSNLEKRFVQHDASNYSGYTITRKPVKLIYSERLNDIRDAILLEKKIKGWSRKKKEALIQGDLSLLKELAACKNESSYLNFSHKQQ
ncbi:MAG TPA: GIY-YIG nuclease family protein [Ignavibacteriaceae bacterium]|nr:GIY-YIG nuclease family protein [Ignavibacteriaceae bacterium]